MSPPHNSSLTGQAMKDYPLGQAHAPTSALRILGQKAWQRIAGIGHPLPLRFFIRISKDGRWLLCPSPEPADN